jgi:hypothetical protein
VTQNAVVVTQVEALRAALLSIVTSGASMLILLHVIFLDASQLAGITAFASNAIVLVFLFWKPRIQQDPAAIAASLTPETAAALIAALQQRVAA